MGQASSAIITRASPTCTILARVIFLGGTLIPYFFLAFCTWQEPKFSLPHPSLYEYIGCAWRAARNPLPFFGLLRARGRTGTFASLPHFPGMASTSLADFAALNVQELAAAVGLTDAATPALLTAKGGLQSS